MAKAGTEIGGNAPLSYARIPAVIVERFRVPDAPILEAVDPKTDGRFCRIRQAPLAGMRDMVFVLKENFSGPRLIDAGLMVMSDPPRPDMFLIFGDELRPRALLHLVICGEEDKALWVRGRGFWVRYSVNTMYGASARELGTIPETWRRRLHQIELFADGLARKHAGECQGFWQGEYNPRGSYREKPEGG